MMMTMKMEMTTTTMMIDKKTSSQSVCLAQMEDDCVKSWHTLIVTASPSWLLTYCNNLIELNWILFNLIQYHCTIFSTKIVTHSAHKKGLDHKSTSIDILYAALLFASFEYFQPVLWTSWVLNRTNRTLGWVRKKSDEMDSNALTISIMVLLCFGSPACTGFAFAGYILLTIDSVMSKSIWISVPSSPGPHCPKIR